MTPDELLTTCIADEAGGEPHEGKVCVAIVLLNRMAIPYHSDGTATGTVLKKDQFSGFWFEMVDGVYTRVCHTLEESQARAEEKFEHYSAQPVWADCVLALNDARAWEADEPMSFTPGPAFAGMTGKTVNYLNPSISHTAWATPDKQDAVIYRHVFYHA